eukprot:6213749-Pleurochrysis_carterae.AAC.2
MGKRKLTWKQVRYVLRAVPRSLIFCCQGKIARDKRRAYLFSEEGYIHHWKGMSEDLAIDLQARNVPELLHNECVLLSDIQITASHGFEQSLLRVLPICTLPSSA